jgi:polysaccharide chain length determinant protein (PEP-CTERM system associated)
MNAETGIQIGDLWPIVRRRGKVAGFVLLGVVLAGYWIAMALPNMYMSYATVLVEPQSVDQELVRAGVQSADLNERLNLMTAQILSRPRLSRIIDQYSLYEEESKYLLRENVIDLMRDRVNVDPVVSDLDRGRFGARDAEINQFRIVFSDENAQVARDVAQQIANDFIETHINARVQVSQKSLEFIQGELERLSERIGIVESQIAEVKNQNPGKLPEDMAANQRRLERILTDLTVAQRNLAEAISDEGFYASQVAAAQGWGSSQDPASPARRLEELRVVLAQLRSRGYTEKHPDIIAGEAEVAELERTVAAVSAEEAEAGQLSLLQQQAQSQVNRARLRRIAAEEEIARLEGLADEFQALLGDTPAVAEKLDALNRDYEHLFSSFQDFSKRHQEASVQAQLERRQLCEQFRVIEAAFVAPKPSAPNRLLILFLAVILGIGAGFGVGIFLEATDTSVHDARKLQTRLQLPVLASIPQIWLETDRAAQRRQRVRLAAATAAIVAFCLVGGAANYVWVNGAPGFLKAAVAGGESEREEG